MPQKEEINLKQSIRWLTADTETPISLYMKLIQNGDGILLESAEVDGRWGRYSILCSDSCFYIRCVNGNLDIKIIDPAFNSLAAFNGEPFLKGLRSVMRSINIEPGAADMPPISRALYGYFGFGMASVFNPHLRSSMPLEEADCCLTLPATVLIFDHLYNRLCQISLGKHRELSANIPLYYKDSIIVDKEKITSSPTANGYKQFVEKIKVMLREGEAIQVVPSVEFSAPFEGNPFHIYRSFRRINASPYMYYMHFPEILLFGSSPEVMVRCTEGELQLSPIAGTRRRGRTDAEDAALAQELLADPKERAEHVMLVDLGRNDLGKVAKVGSVHVDKYMNIEKFSHVMHLTSSISAQLGDSANGVSLDALDVLAATFPAGTVSGAPKFRAMEIIRELEGKKRGPYGGCIGWLGLDDDSVNMDMGITIRSMWATANTLYWQAGGGIVHDSNPELEWKEVCNKSAIMSLSLQEEDGEYVPAHR